jgi:putative endonuclease
MSPRWRKDGSRVEYAVYFMSNSSMTLYIGVTNDLEWRVRQHKNGTGSKFTSHYRCVLLVYFETFGEISDAIAREKQLKGWKIKTLNPKWEDLSEHWGEDVLPRFK